jgi:GT2 family glycosyltransferase
MPLFSVVTPVYDPPEAVLRACLESVRAQTFADWEHCLVDDGSTLPHVRAVLAEHAAADPRVRVLHREANGGIIAASNDALAMATGEFVALLDHDDLIVPDALAQVATAIAEHPDIDYCYSDEDNLSPRGELITPFYKPDWSPERFRSQMYTCHLGVLRRALVDEVGRFNPGFEGSQDFDLVLRVTERARRVHHIPHILYHWRMLPTSVAGNAEAKPYAYESGRRAVQAHCDRIGLDAVVEHGRVDGVYRVRRNVVSPEPLVSVVIPTRGSRGRVWGVERCFVVECVRSLVELCTYPNLEFVVVADTPTPPGVIRALERVAGDRLKVVWYDRPFNFSEKMNLGAAHATGPYLLLLNDDIEVVSADFLHTMVGIAAGEDDVAMVGAKLLFADGRLQHAGHVYNDGNPYHAMFRFHGDEFGPSGLLLVQRECSGVTAACALVKATVFDEVGGFTPHLGNNFNDVDFSLKIRHKGYRIIWTPHAELYHFESMTREPKVLVPEHDFIKLRWWRELNHDPYYNPNLAPSRDDWVEADLA